MKRFCHKVFACLLGLLCCTTCQAGASAEHTADQQNAIEDAIAQETSANYVMDTTIPTQYLTRCEQRGTLEEIKYTTKDYFGDGAEYTKRAFVYLPYGYSTEKKYKVLILCHGIGGNEYEWGMSDDHSKVRSMMDHLIVNDEIEPFIIVTPNGRAGNMSRPGIEPNTSYQSFYLFGQELRNDLLPYIDAHYSTYGSGAETLADARDSRAMAGLSMGGMQTINIGMGECLDLFSWFGAFSACPTTNPAAEIVRKLAQFPDESIHYFYNICGTGDNVAYPSAAAAAKNILPLTDHLTEANFTWQEQPGAHDFGIWYVGFFNFARIFGAK